jgi:hypothetical protein
MIDLFLEFFNYDMMTKPDNTLPSPALDEHDIAAVMGLLIRIMRIDEANKRDREIVAERQAALEERAPSRQKLVTALGAFGFETSDPDIWVKVRGAISEDKYANAWKIAKDQPLSNPSEQKKETEVAGGVDLKVQSAIDIRSNTEKVYLSVPKIADAILAFLRSRPDNGGSVGEIKKHLLNAYELTTHEKTPGMTLYRLSKDGLVHRKGRIWFATHETDQREANALQINLIKNKEAADR